MSDAKAGDGREGREWWTKVPGPVERTREQLAQWERDRVATEMRMTENAQEFGLRRLRGAIDRKLCAIQELCENRHSVSAIQIRDAIIAARREIYPDMDGEFFELGDD